MTLERLKRLQAEIADHLDNGIIPFWLTRAEDAEFGGYLTGFDSDGIHTGTSYKYLNTQCRLLWTTSNLLRVRARFSGAAHLAEVGATFLNRFLWDAEFPGWRWKITRDGSPVDDGKIVYGQSFAIYALAEHALATGDEHSKSRASETFDLLQKYAADTRYGGYFENLKRDWTVEEPGFSGGDRKSLDTHMHLMESFTVLYQATAQHIHRRKLLELVDLIAARMIDPANGCGLNQFRADFTPIPAISIKRTWNAERMGEQPANPTETTSYGHNVELSWLMRRALEAAGADAAPYEPVMRRLLDHAVERGVDWEYGGIYRDGLRSGGPLVLEKEFWQHAESLVGFLDGYEFFGDERYLDAFDTVWRFCREHMILPVGEWRTLCDRFGKPIDSNIGNDWKVSYHTGRAMLECAVRLERLIAG